MQYSVWLSDVKPEQNDALNILIGLSPVGWQHFVSVVYRINGGLWKTLDAFWQRNQPGLGGEDEIWLAQVPFVFPGDSVEFCIRARVEEDVRIEDNLGKNFLFTLDTGEPSRKSSARHPSRSLIDYGAKKVESCAHYRKRRQALEKFRVMLEDDAKEKEWQNLFNNNPYIFSVSLPVKYDALYKQVPLVEGTPDYAFYRRTSDMSGDYGVIELKRPKDRIIGKYSTKFIYPSDPLRRAQQQASQYLEGIRQGHFLDREDYFLAGNRRHAFIIIGRDAEISRKCRDELLHLQYLQLLPEGFHLYTYDELFNLFSRSGSFDLRMLFISPQDQDSSLQRVLRRQMTMVSKYGLDAYPASLLFKTAGLFRAEVFVRYDDETTPANSIMGMLMLGIAHGDKYTVFARGVDAPAVLEALEILNDNGFYRQPEEFERFYAQIKEKLRISIEEGRSD